MKKQEENSLDKLFASLNELHAETPNAAFIEDLEARLNALGQKRRKLLGIWWFWSAFGAILSIGLLAYWQREASSSLASKPQKMEQKTQRFSDANNPKVATFHLNSSKLNSSISLNTSILTSSPSHLNISSLNTPPIFSHLPSE
ncbi:MAG: hypothetical protein RIS63_1231, partial [Bacteroidota bacterium]